MKPKTFAIIASSMIFGAAILMGIAVVAIMLLSRNNETLAAANTAELTESEQNLTAQTTPPIDFVYLVEGQTNNLIRVNTVDGSTQELSLGLTPDLIYVTNMAFTDDGRLVAFCAVEQAGDNGTTTRLIVRDINAGTNIMEQSYNNLPGCNPSVFNADASQLAVGFVFNSDFDGQNFPNEPDWALRVFDINTGNVVHELSKNSPNAPDYESMREDFWFEDGISAMTRAIQLTEDEVLFTAFPFIGRDGPLRVPAHRWNLLTDEVTPIEGLTELGATFLAETGEIVYPYLDKSLPAGQPMGPMPLANTVRINDNGIVRTIYQNTEDVIAATRFITGGEQIAVTIVPAWDENNPNEQPAPTRDIILNRDGSIDDFDEAFIYHYHALGTDDGFIMGSVTQNDQVAQKYELMRYQNGQLTTIWTRTGQEGNIWLEFVWSPPMTVSPNLPDFTPIQ